MGPPRASLVSPHPSPQEITECCRAIQTEAVALNPGLGPLLVLPLHPGVGRAAQKVYEVLEESGRERRVIVTHWLADSSFSLGTVRFVIDSGLELRNVSAGTRDSAEPGGMALLWRAGRGEPGEGVGGLRLSVSPAWPGLCAMPRAGGCCAGCSTCPGGVAVAAPRRQGLRRRQGLACRCPFSRRRLQVYNPRIRAESQVLRPISKSQAESRMQRAAGSSPGESPCPGVPEPASGGEG